MEMEHNMLPLALLAFPLILLLYFFQNHITTKKPTRPPGPRGLPIIGNLHQLSNSSLCVNLWQLSKKYGPIFSLQLGLRPALIVCSPKLAKEILKTRDLEFCNRPCLISQMTLSYGGLDVAFSPYSDHWREMRKIFITNILSSRSVSMHYSIRKYEIGQMIKKISENAYHSKVTNLNERLMSLTSTIICRIAFGRSYEEEGIDRSRFHGLLNELQALVAAFFYTDYIPFMGWIDKFTGLMARLQRNFKEFDAFYQDVIDEHVDPKRQKPEEEEDIIDVLLKLYRDNSFSTDFSHDHIKPMMMNILAAGTDTSAATCVWAMTALMKNPRVMQKVQAEVRKLFGGKEFIETEDIQKLPYLRAVVKETLRLYPVVPLLLPRETTEKCFIEGYEIPEKTLVYVNAWAVHRDPEAWQEPEEFHPERFIENNNVDFKGQDFELISFGAGRRICPGMHMGVTTVELIIANLLHSFDWEMPKGMKIEDIDMEMLPGIAQHKKNPLCLVPKNRA